MKGCEGTAVPGLWVTNGTGQHAEPFTGADAKKPRRTVRWYTKTKLETKSKTSLPKLSAIHLNSFEENNA